jgi:hypothetical protein
LYLKTEAPKLVRKLNHPIVNEREVSPLLKITGWHLHLQDYMKTKADVKNLCALVKVPSYKFTTGLGRLRDIVDAYMMDVRQKARDSPIGVKSLLMECPP